MRILKTREEIRNYLGGTKGQTIGFVPTMGALHKGHLSLVGSSKLTTDITVVSIFVNPTQFNDPNDLNFYPRDLDDDIVQLSSLLTSRDLIFLPSVDEIYRDETPPDIDLGYLDKVMEGEYRPGHFTGVVRVVNILFDIIKPDFAFFGQKDFQQLTIIREMVKQLGLTLTIVSCPIIREENGLAMSSRNERLKPDLRQKAGIIFETLNRYRYVKTPGAVKQVIESVIEKIDSVDELRTQYFVIIDELELKAVGPDSKIDLNRKYFGCIAVHARDVRLIDNVEFSFPVSKG